MGDDGRDAENIPRFMTEFIETDAFYEAIAPISKSYFYPKLFFNRHIENVI